MKDPHYTRLQNMYLAAPVNAFYQPAIDITELTRPVSTGRMRSVGKIVNANKTQFIAEAIVYDADGKELGRGNGVFMRSKIPLANVPGYKA